MSVAGRPVTDAFEFLYSHLSAQVEDQPKSAMGEYAVTQLRVVDQEDKRLRNLMAKYVTLIRSEEGIDYLDFSHRANLEFTKEEIKELRSLVMEEFL